MNLITEYEFEEKFKPIYYGEEQTPVFDRVPKFAKASHVWTIVDADDSDSMYALPGYHIVNKVGYVITEEEWPDLDVEAEWYIPDHETSTEG